MRIALLSFEYRPETGFGGIGAPTWHHVRALRDLGREVHVLAGALSRPRTSFIAATTAWQSCDSEAKGVACEW